MTARRCDPLPWHTGAAVLAAVLTAFALAALAAVAIDAKADGTVSEHSDYVFVGCDD
jgi:hypothetical protein